MGKAASMETYFAGAKNQSLGEKIQMTNQGSSSWATCNLPKCDGIGQGITLQYIGAYNGSLASNLRS